MIKVISKKGAVQALYYLMALEGVTSFENERFEEIGVELLGDDFLTLKEEIISECKTVVGSIEEGDERYDVIQEAMDRALNDAPQTADDGVVPRLLLWDMLTIAHSDSDYSADENRMISHVTRFLQIDKSVFLEMKQLISTACSVVDEKRQLEASARPYSEIRPLIDEVEKREKTIIEAAKTLIEDDFVLNADASAKKEENIIISTGKRIGDSIVDGGKKIGEKVAPLMKNIGDFASSSVSRIAEGAGKLFSKPKNTDQNDSEPNQS